MLKHHAASYSPHNKALPALLSLLALAGILTVTACGGSPGPTTPDAHTLITRAQAAIQKVTSYHFNLAVDNPGTSSTLVIKTADGDILVPDKLKASANVLVIGNVVQVKIITIGSNQYITDPISNNWLKTSGLLDPRILSDSNTGASAILGHLQNTNTPTDSSANGTP